MLKRIVQGAMLAATLVGSSALAQVNLTAETASPGGATYLSPAHLTEIAGTQGIANIQLADGQTLTNSIQNVAEGKTDIAGTPFILPFLMSRGVGPYGSLGAEQGAELAGNLRVINPFTLVLSSIEMLVNPISICLIFFPLAVVYISISMPELTFSVGHIISPLTFVFCIIWPDLHTRSLSASVTLPYITSVNRTIFER